MHSNHILNNNDPESRIENSVVQVSRDSCTKEISRVNPDYATVSEVTRFVNIRDIIPIQQIPDFREPTDSLNPIVAKTPQGFYLLDGMDLILAALERGSDSVLCFVQQVNFHSDIDLCLRKVAVRSKPLGGTCSYSEKVLMSSILYNMLLCTRGDLLVYKHGGRRQDADSEDKGENIRSVIASRMCRSIPTVSKYLHHANYLKRETLDCFVARELPKEFFASTLKRKDYHVRELQSKGASESEIAELISSDMEDMCEKFMASEGTAHFDVVQREGVTSHLINEVASAMSAKPSFDLTEPFYHWTPEQLDSVRKMLMKGVVLALNLFRYFDTEVKARFKKFSQISSIDDIDLRIQDLIGIRSSIDTEISNLYSIREMAESVLNNVEAHNGE